MLSDDGPKTATLTKTAVLIVEDDVDLMDLLTQALRNEPIELQTAYVPEEALRLLELCGPPKLMITDYRFPSTMTGFDLAAEAVRRHPSIQVIVTSGMDREELEARNAGHFPILEKPYSFHAMRQLVQRLLGYAATAS